MDERSMPTHHATQKHTPYIEFEADMTPLTPQVAAEHAGVSAERIRQLARERPGFARRVGRRWRVDPVRFAELLAEHLGSVRRQQRRNRQQGDRVNG